MPINQIRQKAEEAIFEHHLEKLKAVSEMILIKRSRCMLSPQNDIELEHLLSKIEKEIKHERTDERS